MTADSRRIIQLVPAPEGLFAQYSEPYHVDPAGNAWNTMWYSQAVHAFALVEDKNGRQELRAVSCGYDEDAWLIHDVRLTKTPSDGGGYPAKKGSSQ